MNCEALHMEATFSQTDYDQTEIPMGFQYSYADLIRKVLWLINPAILIMLLCMENKNKHESLIENYFKEKCY